MNLAALLNKLFNKQLFKDREKCKQCYYLESVSNYSPCYECVCNDKYEPVEYDWELLQEWEVKEYGRN